MPALHLASFRIDATVPIGHPLCGGWIKHAEVVTEPLYAMGIVLLGEEAPIVLCAVDWTGICNDAHRFWREHLAKAAHTTPERVSVHCVHQHNAPFADLAAQKLVSEQKGLASIIDTKWFEETVKRAADAVQTAMGQTRSVSHLGYGHAKVEKVASNRRIVGPNGKLSGWRGSSCKDAKLREEPEGLIDPWLKTISFWNGEQKLAALHFYATHPMSYYGDGQVSSDFVGLAREARAQEDGAPHIYFTGCAGNIAAGKYNDGSRPNRFLLADRIYRAMVHSEEKIERLPAASCTWHTRPVVLPPRPDETEAVLLQTIADSSKTTAVRNRSAMKLSYRRRAEAKTPIYLGNLRFGDQVQMLHMPAESFVEFQLFAQEKSPHSFLATAAYGDGGPWYIPLAKAFGEGGYEPSVAFADPEAETILKDEIGKLLKS
jgi:hypothetical protein